MDTYVNGGVWRALPPSGKLIISPWISTVSANLLANTSLSLHKESRKTLRGRQKNAKKQREARVHNPQAQVHLENTLHTWLRPKYGTYYTNITPGKWQYWSEMKAELSKGTTYIFICIHLQKVIFHSAQMLPDKCPGNSQYFHRGWRMCHRWGGENRVVHRWGDPHLHPHPFPSELALMEELQVQPDECVWLITFRCGSVN